MTNTQYYKLKKPGDSDNVLISDLNGNMDAVDAALHEIDQKIVNIPTPDVSGQIGTHNADGTAHGDIRSALSGHVGDGEKHITAAERTAWNGKAEGNHMHTPASIGAAPAYTYGTADLEAGTSSLATGKLYFVYE
ncbi:MAG: hypothetical protein ACOX81_10185 [Candidatus Heteroscillospira sp.]|jgi:hypothetical protein